MFGLLCFLLCATLVEISPSPSGSRICFENNTRCDSDFAYLKQRVQFLTTDHISYGQRYSKDTEERKRQEKSIIGKIDTLTKDSENKWKESSKQNDILEKRIDIIEQKVHKKFQASVAGLTAENAAYKVELKNLAETMDHKLTKTGTKLADLENLAKTTNQNLTKTEAKLADLERRLLNAEDHCRGNYISFSSFVTPSISSIRKGVTIPFKGVRNNVGNGYDPATGLFTAPVSGTYFFYGNLLLNSYGEAAIYVNGIQKAQLLASEMGANSYQWAADANSVIVHLQQGNTVYIRMIHQKSTFYIHHLWSTFSGFLLKAD